MKKFSKALLTSILILFVCISSFSVYTLYLTKNTVFDEKKLFTLNNTTYLDCNDSVITDVSTKDVQPITLQSLPDHVKNAFIAIEDKRFYKHNGIDFKRIIGATIKNLKSKGFKEGASTISQQLIKNTHLTNEKTIERKLKELKLTIELEKRYNKNQILEMYLNTIYFGESAYGIQNASRRFFNKDAEALNLAEGAVLAGIIKAPATYSPYRHKEKTVDRKNLVLKCMLDQGYISSKEFEVAKNKDLNLNYETTSLTEKAYLTCVKDELENILKDINRKQHESFNVHTYYNPKLSNLAASETCDLIKNTNYCTIICDNEENSIVGIATDVGLIKRSPASTVKPWLVYSPAIEERAITSATKILDEKTNFNGYTPTEYNDKYYGYVSVKESISKSLNIPAVKTANCLGMQKIKEYASKMDVDIKEELGIALGGIEGGMTLKEICDCYSVFSNEGNFSKYKFIKKITTKNGKTVYENKPDKQGVFSEETVYIINDALNECVKTGTAKKLNKYSKLCAKTGTNGTKNGNLDAYSISFSPAYTVAVWTGNADNSIMPNSISGGTYPTIVAAEIWKELTKEKQLPTPSMPAGVIKVQLNDETYKKDCIIEKGNGTEFLFIRGTEPKNGSEKAKEIFNVKQFCENGLYTLSYELDGYDGADIILNGIQTEAIHTSTFTKKLTEGLEYSFTVIPFYLDEAGQKKYGEPINLPSIKYEKENKPRPPKNDWWTDD